MKTVELEPRIIRKAVAETYVGGPAVLTALQVRGFVKAFPSAGKLVLFDRRKLDLALDRWEIEGGNV